jgi:protein-S-isoprenylcysteine O-methyltransferase Ste14
MRPFVPPPLLTLVLAAVMWILAYSVSAWRFDFPFRWLVAAVVLVVGAVIPMLSFRTFRRAGTTTSPRDIGNASSLVTTGPYAISRNPMYLGLLLMLTAWALALGQALNAVFPVLFVVWTTLFQIGPEERMLREKFGEAYAAYCRRVRRWI